MFSISPNPNNCNGIRNERLLFASWVAKSSCTAVQPALAGSLRSPACVQRAWTPPSGRPVVGSTLNRTSRMGPNSVSKEGTTFFRPNRCGTRSNCGFLATSPLWAARNPPDPPNTGCAWQVKQLSALWRVPNPLELVMVCGKSGSISVPRGTNGGATGFPLPTPNGATEQVSQMDSSCPARLMPSRNSESSIWLTVRFGWLGFGLMSGGWGIGIPCDCSPPTVLFNPPLTPGSLCATATADSDINKTAVPTAVFGLDRLSVFENQFTIAPPRERPIDVR